VAVFKATGRLLDASGTPIGEGRAYIHLRQPADQAQRAQGTLSLDWWNTDDGVATEGVRLDLNDGPGLTLDVESDKLSECVAGRILRYSTNWPGSAERSGSGGVGSGQV
jgi:hypothetical protein